MRRWVGIAGALALSMTIPVTAQVTVPEGWQQQASPTDDDLHAAFFLDATTGWIVAHRSGAVLHTGDGGATWEVRAELDTGFREWIDFRDPLRGWLCGEGEISITTDGGGSWTRATIEGESDTLALGSLLVTGPRSGIALGFDSEARAARVLASDDDGATWRPRPGSAPDGPGFTDALAVDSASATILAGGFGIVYRSGDGGASWQAVPLEGDDVAVRGLAAIGRRGWAVGDGGLLARSDDGGRTWRVLPRISGARLRGVLFADRQTGWIVGDLGPKVGLVYETRDGGERWRRLDAELPALHRIVRGGDRLWIVGASGTILSRPAPTPPPPPPDGTEPSDPGRD